MLKEIPTAQCSSRSARSHVRELHHRQVGRRLNKLRLGARPDAHNALAAFGNAQSWRVGHSHDAPFREIRREFEEPFDAGLRVQLLERRLAEREAICSIESYCMPAANGRLDTAKHDQDAGANHKEAVHYLELRGLLERRKDAPHIVRVREEQ